MSSPLPKSSAETALRHIAAERILVLDGGMGTMIQDLKLSEAEFRGKRFADHGHDLRGNNDLLILTQPDAIRDIHLSYYRAGADIVSTNTFSSTAIAQADYKPQNIAVTDLNREGAKLVREAAAIAAKEDGRPRYVAGAHRADQPHRLDFAGREQSRLPRHHLRRAESGLSRAGARPCSKAASIFC